MDSIVTKGMSVGEFKKQLIQEAYHQGIEYPLQLDRSVQFDHISITCLPHTLTHTYTHLTHSPHTHTQLTLTSLHLTLKLQLSAAQEDMENGKYYIPGQPDL